MQRVSATPAAPLFILRASAHTDTAKDSSMTITKRVQKELVQAVPPADNQLLKSLRKHSRAQRTAPKARSNTEKNKGKAWTPEEHERFLVALDKFPSGPWKAIANYVGTKDSRQTMTHAQKYRQKHERQQRGLRNRNKTEKSRKQVVKKATAGTQATAEQPMADDIAQDDSVPERDAALVEMSEALEFDWLPIMPSLTKQLSDSPRSADEGACAVNSDPFAPVVADDSLLTMALDAGAAWLSVKGDNNLTKIFLEIDEPVAEAEWPQMWSTNSLEEIVTSCSQFDFIGEGAH
ncbi:hypothetical protein F444_03306 [Phytophthora nicotianae P1976]|uniref:Uncharacterized protein n=1 Tax=Phytophthora nicotianae P1976 TaxID=1317066 RepID=A0A081AUG8_PHYNI|nr:hypothetical protein F444_03306 [Phytophthora nicotianae P1976]